ncbi:phage tail protein [uncultured Paraglaciecola sp.]|uniref:phage tail protein n=1 Tax=uncultured Paraglaciecola sp. TaxID=1765024 RepID=UPI002630FF95|nr:phage tail protein [uncultured Paraglaciecola sp.]
MPPVILAVAAVAAYSGAYQLAVALLFSAISMAMADDEPDFDNNAVNPVDAQEITTSANQPRKVIYGEAIVGGQIIGYRKIRDGIHNYHYMVINIAGHSCQSVEIYEIDGVKPVDLIESVDATYHLGDQTQAVPFAVENIEDWTEQHVGFGLTNAYLKIKIDPDVFPNGVNQIKFKVKGKRIYDPRQDATKGGSGAQRADDSTTWQWSDNAILCNYDYVRNHGYRPIPARRIPWDFVALTANYCDAPVDYLDADGATQTESRFTCNGVLTNTLKPGDSLKSLLSTCGAKIYRPNGQIYIKPAMYGGPATITLTPDDFVTQPNYQPSRPENGRYNLVRPEYVEPSLKYQITGAPVVTHAAYVASDGVELDAPLKLYLTNSRTMAQRLGKRYLERSRAGFTGALEVAGIRLDIAPGMVIKYLDPQTGIDREFVVQDFKVDVENKQTILSVEEESVQIHAEDVYAQITLLPNTSLPDTTVISEVKNVTYTPKTDAFRQGVLAWDHDVPSTVVNCVVLIATEAAPTVVVKKYSVVGFEVDIAGLVAGEYVVVIKPFNRFGRSPSSLTTHDLQVNVVVTPTNLPSVSSRPGFISVTPVAPLSVAAYYEFKHFDAVDSTVVLSGAKNSITIFDVKPDVTYSISYRLYDQLLNEHGDWIEVDVNGIEKVTYIWYVYADDDTGTGISLSPTNKAYFGIAAGRSVSTVSIADPSIFDYYPQPAGGGGSAGITAQLSETAGFVNVEADGSGASFTGVATTLSIIVGMINDTAAWTVSVSESSGVSGSLTGHTYSVTDLTGDIGTVTFTATRSGQPTFVRVFTIIKIKNGEEGISAFQSWLNNGNTGDIDDFLADLNGSDGFDGNEWFYISSGAPSSGIGKVNDFALSTGRYVYQKTGASTWTYRYDLKGNTGSPGISAYQVWLNNGNSGNESAFLADLNGNDGFDGNEWFYVSSGAPSGGIGKVNDFALSTGRYVYQKTGASTWTYRYDLKGANGSNGSNGSPGSNGSDGADGLSAYQIWLNNGNSGSISAFLADLNGNDGFDGNEWFYISSGAPSGGLGKVNDFALSAGRYVYQKTGSSSWSYRYDLKGEDGSQGPAGPIGPPGEQGPSGDAEVFSIAGTTTNISSGGGAIQGQSVYLEAGTYKVDMEIQASAGTASNTFLNLEIAWRRGTSTVSGRYDSDIGFKFPQATVSYHGTTYLSAGTYSLWAKLTGSDIYSEVATGYMTAEKQ